MRPKIVSPFVPVFLVGVRSTTSNAMILAVRGRKLVIYL